MSHTITIFNRTKQIYEAYADVLRRLVMLLAYVSGLSILFMTLITFLDVILRIFGMPIIGVYDVVRIAGTLTIATALPYTTAVKGHVAIEYFFQKLSKPWRVVVDTLARLISMSLFGLLTWHSILYGESFRRSGEVSTTLQFPIFWVSYVIALSCAVTALVILHKLLHPGKEMIAP